MAQFAVHIATGLLAGDVIKPSKSMLYALVIGAFAPDLDFIPMLAIYLFNPELASSFHRSFSHSLFLPLLIFLICWIWSKITHLENVLSWGVGLAFGLLTHVILDILFWFDTVKMLWPLDLWGISTTVAIWQGVDVPVAIKLLIGPASEFLAYGLLFFYFMRRAYNSDEKNRTYYRVLRWAGAAAILVFAIFVTLIFFLPEESFVEYAYSVTSFSFAPLSLYLLWKLRHRLFRPNNTPAESLQLSQV